MPNDAPDWESTSAGQQVIGTLAGGPGAGVGPNTIPVPGGTNSIGYLVRFDGGNQSPTLLTIQGAQSLDEYVNVVPPTSGAGPVWVPYARSDSQVLASIQCAAAGGSKVDILASPLVLTAGIFTAPGTSAQVELVDSLVRPITTYDVLSTLHLLGVAMTDADPSTWQQATAPILSSSQAVVAATYTTILAPVGAGKQLLLWWARFDLDAASGGVFAVSSDGATANVFNVNDNARGPYVLGPFPGGVKIGPTNSKLAVFSTNANTVRFSIAYGVK